jgi:hypothetical protein
LNHKTGEVVAGTHARQDCAPNYDTTSDVLGRREDLEHTVVKWDGRHITSIVDGSKQRILAGTKASILLEAHNSSIGEAVTRSVNLF